MQETKESIGAILAEHYQKTSELTDQAREARDRTFLYLLLALGIATLFSVDANSSNSLLTTGLGKFLDKPALADALKDSPLLANIQTLLLAVGLYLLMNLYNRTVTVLRNYQYLGAMESEIRGRLGLREDDVSFTREGDFYWKNRTPVLNRNRQIFTLFLIALLLFSFISRVYSDVRLGQFLIALPDVALGIASLYYLNGYHRVSKGMDMPLPSGQAHK